jgi:hypothetical protein
VIDAWLAEHERRERALHDPLLTRVRALNELRERHRDAPVVNWDFLIESQAGRLYSQVKTARFEPEAIRTVAMPPRAKVRVAVLTQVMFVASQYRRFDEGVAHLNAIAVVRQRDAEIGARVEAIRSEEETAEPPWVPANAQWRPGDARHLSPSSARCPARRAQAPRAHERPMPRRSTKESAA